MNQPETTLKTQHKFSDFLYWNSVLAVPFVTACIAIFKTSILWLIFYIAICIVLTTVIYRFYCTHCPHYTQSKNTTKCMFFWGIPKFFNSRPGPLTLFEKTVSMTAPAIILFFPFYWLILQPGLLVIYVLSLAVFVTTIRRNECHRCVYFNCPANCVPDDVRNEASLD